MYTEVKFSKKLASALEELELSQVEACRLTGVSKPAMSQYLSGVNVPPKAKQERIAKALGLEKDFFENREDTNLEDEEVFNVLVEVAAKAMGKSREFVEQGLQQQRFDFGYAVQMNEWSYFISSAKFYEKTGIRVKR